MFKKKPAFWLSVILSIVLFLMALMQFGPLEYIELTTYDWRMRLRAPGPDTKTDIVLVEIDNDSITKLGRWPWPRHRVAGVIDKMKDYGASMIGLNVFFSEQEEGEGLKLVEELKKEFATRFDPVQNPEARAFWDKLNSAQGRLDNDKILADSIARAKEIMLPVFFDLGRYPKPDRNLPEVLVKNGLIQVREQDLMYMLPARKITDPISRFSEAAAGLGHINFMLDPDGAIRREPLLVDYKGLAFPSYTLRMAIESRGLLTDQVKVTTADQGREGIGFGQDFVPTDNRFIYYITFTASEAFQRFSFFDVLNDKVQPAAFKDKIVIIGVSATGVDMPKVTPLDKEMSTSTLLANSLHNLLEGDFMVRTDMLFLLELLMMILVGVFLALGLPRMKPRIAALATVGLLVLIIGSGLVLFVVFGLWFKITYAVLLTALGYAAVTTSQYFFSEAGKAKAEGESAEVNRMLGLSFQNQGQLDLAFDKFRRVPVDEGMKDILYNLGLDYERKRMFNKAVAVYEYIKEHDGEYRDIKNKIKKLNIASETAIFGLGSGAKQSEDGTLVMDENTRPTLGRYEILKELGKGAMGVVYLGKDPALNREMAIKTIRFNDEYEEDEAEKVKDQFFAEAKTAGMLSHPNIVTIYDAGTDHDVSYIAMELLEGYDFKEHSSKDNLLPIRDVIRHIADVAEALGYAHSMGVVHRDIKPANIMLLKKGIAKVTDFGIARAMASSKTKTGVVKGTPFYMSPEQITGKKVDGRSDIFSLGVVLFELLTGTQPFKGDDLITLINKITNEDPVPINEMNPKIPRAVAQIIEKAMVKDRDKRYQKAEQMAEHLRIIGRKMDELAAKRQAGNQ